MVMSQVRPLNAELQKIAIKELNEVPERMAEDLNALKAWIKQQPHLRARTDDQFLLAFLRGSKYSLETAKTKLDKYYTMRTKYPDLFQCHDVDKPIFREILRWGIMYLLPTPLHGKGSRICIANGKYPMEKFSVVDIMNVMSAVIEILILEDDVTCINGLVFATDMTNVKMSFFNQVPPSLARKLVYFCVECLPFRFKASHYFNISNGLMPIYNILKPMLPKKLQKRLFLHGDRIDSLYERMPKIYLPVEYGGTNGSIEDITAYWNKKMDEYRDYFKDNVNYGTDEHLRQGKPIDFESMFGLDGSFRQLNLD